MAADYDRLFESPEGMDIPDEAAGQAEFDVNAPSEMPPVPIHSEQPNGHIPPPMPIDLAEQPGSTSIESPPPPMPIGLAEQSVTAPTESPLPPVDWAQPSPIARPPMPINVPQPPPPVSPEPAPVDPPKQP
ncbi:ESX-1 associated ATP-binding protein EpsI N-terminal domain-containing protein, partial [Mycobacterium montefiorense]|uniref:ESX-1 associated ATP-binding protein EpsI N-terminal domain-containing protein n=1 Tax=Mycobacterium montefiorense TaxID=154654 RepID=UPI003FD89C5E